MVVQQRVAWFNLIVLSIAVVMCIVLIPVMGIPAALGAFGICGLCGFTNLFYKKRGAQIDERDAYILRKAHLAGLLIFWELFIAVSMISWGVVRYAKHQETISVDVLPMLVIGGWVAFMLAQSIATLIQYGRSRDEA